MINQDMLNRIKPLIIDPSWKEIITARLKYMLDTADKNLKQATIDNFLEKKGAYLALESVYKLFIQPTLFADDGIVQMKLKQDET